MRSHLRGFAFDCMGLLVFWAVLQLTWVVFDYVWSFLRYVFP